MSKQETYEELLKQQDELAKKIEEARQSAVSAVIVDVKSLIEKYNLTADDLGLTAGKGAKAKGKAGAAPEAEGHQSNLLKNINFCFRWNICWDTWNISMRYCSYSKLLNIFMIFL